jgi:beta-lactamase regulating signal transducer with metallopeptidase domain
MLGWVQWHVGPTAGLVNHLWQSTIFLLGAWLLTLVLKHNHAAARYRLWMLASVKFLIPFSLLLGLGQRIELRMARPIDTTHYTWVTYDLAAPVVADGAHKVATSPAADAPIKETPPSSWSLTTLALLWLSGTCFLLTRWARFWWQLRRAVQSSVHIGAASGTPVRETRLRLEPGVFGILRPVLLLPEGIRDRLIEPQMEAILAHELCHVRRRDNLTAAVHMLTEAVFWFHPAVWWIGAQLIEERERACDEAVVASSREAQIYAEGILNVCKFYTEAPMTCVSGVTGSDLKKRVLRIMAQQPASRLDLGRRMLLVCAGMLAIALPVSFGIVHAAAQTAEATGIVDTWQGTLHAGEQNLRTVLKISKDDKGALKLAFYSIDQGGQPISASSVSFDGGCFAMGSNRLISRMKARSLRMASRSPARRNRATTRFHSSSSGRLLRRPGPSLSRVNLCRRCRLMRVLASR